MVRNYVTFHSHPQSLDSASTPEAFAEKELELNTGALVVTDHGTLAACRKIYDLGKKKGLIPILGIENYFRDDNCDILTASGCPKDSKGTFSNYFKYTHITTHFLDQAAFEMGVTLLSKADLRGERHGSERKPLLTWQDLELLGSQNVTVGSGCLVGMVQRHLLDRDNAANAIKYYEKLRSLVKPGNFYVEVFPHVCDKNWVNGIFITLENGNRIKHYDGKLLKTNEKELSAGELAREFNLKGQSGHEQLVAVKNYRVWENLEPLKIVKVEKIEDFLPNECRPWCEDGDVQRGCNQFMIRLARKYGDKIVISDDSHYVHPKEQIVQNVRLNANSKSNWRFYGNYKRQSSQESFEYFSSKLGISESEFEEWVENSHDWASRFKDFSFETKPSLPTKFYPEETLAHTKTLINKHGRMDWANPLYINRLREEIKLLHQNGVIDLLPYFFVGEEACEIYSGKGLLTGPGRGSASGCLLAYLFEITHVNPLEFNLSLDRFLTLDRIKSGRLPDIDIDFPTRDLLVGTEDSPGWLQRRFGDHQAQISVDTKLKLRSSVKDVARLIHGKVPEDIENLTKKFQNAPQGVEDKDFIFGYNSGEGWTEGSIVTDKALQEYIAKYPAEWETVQACLGLYRQKSRHASAFVLTNRPIHEFIPMTTVSDVRVTQYTADAVEAAGGLKMDFLVINSLNDISDCIKLIQQRSGLTIPDEIYLENKRVPKARIIPHAGELYDIWKLWVSPYSKEVFKDISEGKTETVFQFNTNGAVQYLKYFNGEKPNGQKAIDSIEAMAAFTALDRPGPLDVVVVSPTGEKINALIEFARRAKGETPSETLAVINQLLPETYGLLIFQEQLQKVYQTFTDCSGPEAEEFRTNVAKKKVDKVNKAYPFFMEKATIKIGKEDAQKAWDSLQTWGRYGFNFSHAVCYSVIGFACAYLKRHFPLEWWTAVLGNANKNEVSEKFWKYCGHLIALPDVALSGEKFEIQGDRIRAPLNLLHGVGENAHLQLCKGRPYHDIQDFCQKIQQYRLDNKKTNEAGKTRIGTSALNRKVVYTLIISGTMDSLFPKTQKITVNEDGVEKTLEIETTVTDQLTMFERALAEATGKKFKGLDKDCKYTDVNQIVRYQMRKSVLPAYCTPLLPMLVDRKVPHIQMVVDKLHYISYYKKTQTLYPFVSAQHLDGLLNVIAAPTDVFKVAVAAYIEGVRCFSYQGGKEACELLFDIDGHVHKIVKWGRDGKLDKTYNPSLKGSIVVLLLSKKGESKSFFIDDLIIVQESLSYESEQSPGE